MSAYDELSIDKFKELCEMSCPERTLVSVSDELSHAREHLRDNERILLTGCFSVDGKTNLLVMTGSRLCTLYGEGLTSCDMEKIDRLDQDRVSFTVQFNTKWGPKAISCYRGFSGVTEYTRIINRFISATKGNGKQPSKYELMDALEFYDYLSTRSRNEIPYRLLRGDNYPHWLSLKPHLLNSEQIISAGMVDVKHQPTVKSNLHWLALTTERVIWVQRDICNFVSLESIASIGVERDRFEVITGSSKNAFVVDEYVPGKFAQSELPDLASMIRDEIRKVVSVSGQSSDLVSELQNLATLYENGLLSDSEFQAAKLKLLS